jgi:hypothetical protein
MANLFVAPVVTADCVGTTTGGLAMPWFKCKKIAASPVTTNCVNMRLFTVTCPTINQQCNKISNAYLASVTLCRQNIF